MDFARLIAGYDAVSDPMRWAFAMMENVMVVAGMDGSTLPSTR